LEVHLRLLQQPIQPLLCGFCSVNSTRSPDPDMLKAGQCGSAAQLKAHLVHMRSGVAPQRRPEATPSASPSLALICWSGRLLVAGGWTLATPCRQSLASQGLPWSVGAIDAHQIEATLRWWVGNGAHHQGPTAAVARRNSAASPCSSFIIPAAYHAV